MSDRLSSSVFCRCFHNLVVLCWIRYSRVLMLLCAFQFCTNIFKEPEKRTTKIDQNTQTVSVIYCHTKTVRHLVWFSCHWFMLWKWNSVVFWYLKPNFSLTIYCEKVSMFWDTLLISVEDWLCSFVLQLLAKLFLWINT